MDAQPLGWDDLRLFLAVARRRGLSGAARELGVHHATVYRRIEALERDLGARLFERSRRGYELTPAGTELLDRARRIEDEVLGIERTIAGRDHAWTGSVRVTTTVTLADVVLECLCPLRARHPGIEVHLHVDDRVVPLGRGEADVAVRASTAPPEDAVGRRIAKVAWAVYGAKALDGPLEVGPWLALDGPLVDLPAERWARERWPDAAIALRTNAVHALRTAARAGLGYAVLPCIDADGDPDLVRRGDVVPRDTGSLWVLTHAELRRTARIRAVIEIVGDALSERRGRLEGSP